MSHIRLHYEYPIFLVFKRLVTPNKIGHYLPPLASVKILKLSNSNLALLAFRSISTSVVSLASTRVSQLLKNLVFTNKDNDPIDCLVGASHNYRLTWNIFATSWFRYFALSRFIAFHRVLLIQSHITICIAIVLISTYLSLLFSTWVI
jgi:hypothetical protein